MQHTPPQPIFGRMRRWIPGRRFWFVAVPLVLCIVTVLVSHAILDNWWIELLGYGMPVVLFMGAVLLPLACWRGKGWLQRLPVVALALLLIKPARETVAITWSAGDLPAHLSVMNYNVALFNPARPNTLSSESHRYDEFYDMLRNGPVPDVLCIQELYHGFQDQMELAVDSIIKLGGYSSFYMNPRFDRDFAGVIGLATFSKFPVAAQGKIDFGVEGSHNGHWVDLLVGDDTIRVVNFHFRSMSLRWQRFDSLGWFAGTGANLRNFHERLRWGFDRRSQELLALEQHLPEDPRRTILCGDINAVPYSDAYQRLKLRFHNAFERRGFGFGFTYDRFPWFIRIDNQFFSPDLEVVRFRTVRELELSDHYPIEAHYHIRP